MRYYMQPIYSVLWFWFKLLHLLQFSREKKTFENFFKWGVTSVTSVTRYAVIVAGSAFALVTLLTIFVTVVTLLYTK